jgi:hypothetical protein
VLRRRGFTEEGKVRGGALGGSLRLMRGDRGGGGGLARRHMEEGKGGPVHVAWRKTGPDGRPTATQPRWGRAAHVVVLRRERQGRGGADEWVRGHCAGFKPGQPSQKPFKRN